ncbi:hypothetical protein B0H11DRAFT_2220881 [Mycena galericulata]|nr:hypothetical protein B0H11DRAFT_2220881 [Mycena galericulata]
MVRIADSQIQYTLLSDTTTTHRLRKDARIFAVGFVLTCTDVAALARKALPTEFIAEHAGDSVLASKWHCTDYDIEAIDIPKREAILHFYPWVYGNKAPREVENIPPERQKEWDRLYGQHLGCNCPPKRILYPHISLGTVYFMERYLNRVVATHQLEDLLLVPLNPSGAFPFACRRFPLLDTAQSLTM